MHDAFHVDFNANFLRIYKPPAWPNPRNLLKGLTLVDALERMNHPS
jgi:hypothetical protein